MNFTRIANFWAEGPFGGHYYPCRGRVSRTHPAVVVQSFTLNGRRSLALRAGDRGDSPFTLSRPPTRSKIGSLSR